MDTIPAGGPIILFDAECILCSANAQFVLSQDGEKRFRLASMQGEVGSALYRRFGIDPGNPDSIIVVDGEHMLRDSDAVLSIYAGLGWPLKVLSVFRLVPRFIRDPLYLLIARNRYRLFGKRDSCWLPSPEYRDRLL
ncbi:DCC1-like thiol-disulfide oxidoreductase family protein [Rhizobium sp. RU33A]|uniref:thiol-disulfide oxidoreductase DCC family protein n=1 Tax=Rhizobium sp. RU33A TaxID=1907413 RepID=UPI0009713BC5|nr:DCC1-like thiol-disulfide oxidoreductase family protein [Rhizobium sp. RU33A]